MVFSLASVPHESEQFEKVNQRILMYRNCLLVLAACSIRQIIQKLQTHEVEKRLKITETNTAIDGH